MTDVEVSLAEWRQEILSYLIDMRDFKNINLKEVHQRLAAYSARVSEIRMRVVRSSDRRVQSFRTQEIDPFLAEVDRQHKIWSRFQSIVEKEWEMSQKGH